MCTNHYNYKGDSIMQSISTQLSNKYLISILQNKKTQNETQAQKSPELHKKDETQEPLSATTSATSKNNEDIKKEDIWRAYWTIYTKDFEYSNYNTNANEISNCSKRYTENNNKKITNQNEGKAHLKDFVNILCKELKLSNKYNASVAKAIEYIEAHFDWDKYFEKYPNASANTLEHTYVGMLISVLCKNEIGSIFLSHN